MVKSSSLSAYNSILAMVAWWMPVLESPTNLGQMRKKPKGLRSWLLGMHSSSMILEMSKLGLKLCCSIQSFLFLSPVWCCFPNSKGTELFWVASILIFCTLFFHVFGGIKTCNHAKKLRIGWLSYPLFLTSLGTLIIGHKHKVPRELKNKGNYHHSVIVIYWMTIISFIFHFTRDLVFMPERSEGIIKVPREVKNKGYESHPIRNFAWLQVFMP